MEKYECAPCGYIYDPEAGDPDGASPQGRLLRISLTIGCARSAVWEKMSFIRSKLD